MAMSSAVVLSPYCAAIPGALPPEGGITLLKQEPSAQRPWQKTMLGLVCVDFILFSFHELLRQNQRLKTCPSHNILKAGWSFAKYCRFCGLLPKK